MHLIICTERTGMPERSSPGRSPGHVAYHHVQERRAVTPDRVVMRDPRAGKAHGINLRDRVEDPERKPPHHAAVCPAAMIAFVHDQCGMVRHGPGSHKIKEES